MICIISFIKFSYMLPVFICARAIGNIWSICLGVNILSCLAKPEGLSSPFAAFIGNIPLLNTLRINSWP